MSSEKIHAEHLQRPAFVYIRQSTLYQVRHHPEGRRLQYDLEARARQLGWTQVILLDEDLGKSATTAAGRADFQRLVAEVSLGHVGAVFGLEVARLARNNRDWYQLLDLCALMRTLIVDAEAVYEPRQLNDRLLLGLKGTMSEAELGWLRQRALESLRAKAQRGALSFGLPVGYLHGRDGRIEKHPDQRIQHAIALVFERFAALGSIRQALLWFRHEGIALPAIEHAAPWGEHIRWRLPVYNTLHRVLTNPFYAGAYAFGRTGSRTTVVDGRPYTTHGHRRPQDEWTTLLRDHHEPYIAWEIYARNRQLITHNAQMKGRFVTGAVREGRSLLAGLVRCGHCGRRLHVAYSGGHGSGARYSCRGAAVNHGAGRCIAFGGLRVDRAIEQDLIRVLTPGAIEAALASAAAATDQMAARRRALELELREARYEAERAQRQYDAVEPEHRLVVDTLERRWNAALARVAEVDRRLAALAVDAPSSSTPERATLVALAQDFARVWSAATTDMRTKKRIVRLLIEEIIAKVLSDPLAHIELIIHWKGGKHTRLVVPRNRPGQHRWCTDRAIIEVVRDLARTMPDAALARVLNRLGYRTGAGHTWTEARVASLRNYHQIPVFARAADRPTVLTLAEAAKALGVSPVTVRRLIAREMLPASQPILHAPWAIRPEDLTLEGVQRAVEAVKRGGTLPRSASTAQLTLEESQT